MRYRALSDEFKATRRIRRLYVGTAFAVVFCLLGTNLVLLMSAGPTGTGTVLEDGSLMQPGDFMVFRDADTGYLTARNGRTGSIQYANADDDITFRHVINATGNGGTIYMAADMTITFDTDLTIDRPGIIFQGGAASAQWQFGDTASQPTVIDGNIIVENENIKLRDFNLEGSLTLEGPADLSDTPLYFSSDDVAYWGTVYIKGRTGGVAAEVPFNVCFTRGTITTLAPGNLVELNNSGINNAGHIYFDKVILDGKYPGSILKVSGMWADVHFTGCVFFPNGDNSVFIQCQLNPDSNQFGFIGSSFVSCNYEWLGTGTTFITFPNNLNTKPLLLEFFGGHWSGTNQLTVINDDTTGGQSYHRVRFQGIFIKSQTTLQFDSVWNPPGVVLIFERCIFPYTGATTVTNIGGSKSCAQFFNCLNFNPIGVMATPWVTTGAPTCGLLGTLTTPGNTYNFTVRDVPVLITSTGGTVSNIEIFDVDGTPVLSGVTTLNRTYLPIGYHITFTYSVAPTVIVEGM